MGHPQSPHRKGKGSKAYDVDLIRSVPDLCDKDRVRTGDLAGN